MTRLGLTMLVVLLCGCGDDGGSPPDSGGGGDGGGADAGEECILTGEHPLPRGETMGVVDPRRERLVFFGGDRGVPDNCNPAPRPIGELWSFDIRCGEFEQAPATADPSPRARGVAAYDPNGDRMFLFGGRYREATSGPYTLFNDVWELDLETRTWAPVATTGTSPSARSSTAMVFDPTANRLLVFGGNESSSGATFAPLADVWALDLATGQWQSIPTAGTGPEPRLFHAATIDPATGRLYVYGGGDAGAFTGPFLGDLWSLDPAAGTWTEEHAGGAGAPAARIHAGLFFDGPRGRLILFAGHDDGTIGNQNDTWAFDLAARTWTVIVPPEELVTPPPAFCLFPPDFTAPNMNAPDRRSSYLGAVDEMRGKLFVYGGKTDCGNIDDVWSFDFATDVWTRELESTIGEACIRGDNPEMCATLCI